MNIQDYLNRYRSKPLNLIITDIKLNCNSQSVMITATSGFGLEVVFNIPTDTDLDNICLQHGYIYRDKYIVENKINE